jgi:hypothetical protein
MISNILKSVYFIKKFKSKELVCELMSLSEFINHYKESALTVAQILLILFVVRLSINLSSSFLRWSSICLHFLSKNKMPLKMNTNKSETIIDCKTVDSSNQTSEVNASTDELYEELERYIEQYSIQPSRQYTTQFCCNQNKLQSNTSNNGDTNQIKYSFDK